MVSDLESVYSPGHRRKKNAMNIMSVVARAFGVWRKVLGDVRNVADDGYMDWFDTIGQRVPLLPSNKHSSNAKIRLESSV